MKVIDPLNGIESFQNASSISVYPNPITGNTIGLALTDMAQGIYQLKLVNTLGQTIMIKKLTHTTGNSMETLTPAGKLNTGIYQLEVTAPDNGKSSIKVIVK